MKYFAFFLLCLSLPAFAQEPKGVTPLAPSSNFELRTSNPTRAVVVGISDYQDPGLPDLQYARRDAEAFATWLQSPPGGNLRSDRLFLLTNERATLGGLTSALNWLAESIEEGDLAIVYFAGQGAFRQQSAGQESFFLAYDSQPTNFRASAFSTVSMADALHALLEEKKSRVILVTDLVITGKVVAADMARVLTGHSPAEQFAGVLSCQPREVVRKNSGAGLGLFTQHGLEGLYGLADRDQDQTVRWQEIKHYFDQKAVQEALPTPLQWWGAPDWPLAQVQPEYLEKLLFYKNRPAEPVGAEAAGALRIPDGTPPERIEQYAAFRETLTRGDLIDPPGYCAWDLYAQLTPEQAGDKLGKTMRRELCAALQDEAQQALNALLSDDPYELNNWRYNPAQYFQYPEYLRRALELLGPAHYMANALKAKKLYFEAHSLSRNNPDLTRSAAAAEAAKQLAKSKLREALGYQPDAAYLYHAAGYLHFGDYSLDSFMYYYTQAMELSPTWIVPYIDVGQKYMEVFMDLKLAERWFRKALAIKPNSYAALEKLAWLYQWHNEMPEALDICKQMIALRPDLPNGYSTMANIYLAVKSYALAEQFTNKALRLNPRLYWWSFADLGVVYMRTRRFEQGREHFEKALARNDLEPGDRVVLLRHLAEAQIELRQYDEALSTLDRNALVPAGDFLWEAANREALRGKVLALMGRYQEADTVLHRALMIDATPNPYYIAAYAYLGEAQAGLGRPDSARYYFDRSIAYTTAIRFVDQLFYADAHYRYGLYYLRLGRKSASKAAFRRAIKVDPGWYAGYYGMACFYARQGRHALAMDYLERALLRYYPDRSAIETEPAFTGIRDAPRFSALLKRFFDNEHP